MPDLWLGIVFLLTVPFLVISVLIGLRWFVCRQYIEDMLRIFLEKPLFVIPRGEVREGAEDVRFPTFDGMRLHGCYLRTSHPQRKGVILFGLEFGSNRWSCQAYCEGLLQAGYDVFAFEPRNQGESDKIAGYDSRQWLTRYESQDMLAAIAYLKTRDDADPKGIGFFGLSKGANAGLFVGADEKYIRCFATDGAFGTKSTMVPYMRKWVSVYTTKGYLAHGLLPWWFYSWVATTAIRRASERCKVEFVNIEKSMSKLTQPLLMIHGSNDTYIKVPMAQAIFKRVPGKKDFWLVEGAKHNQALQVAGEEYVRRIVNFFDENLAGTVQTTDTILAATPTLNVGQPVEPKTVVNEV